jgi:hypothetical protein
MEGSELPKPKGEVQEDGENVGPERIWPLSPEQKQ